MMAERVEGWKGEERLCMLSLGFRGVCVCLAR